jgi:hypothetical protein
MAHELVMLCNCITLTNVKKLYQPIETWRDVPISTYRSTGKNAMYIPTTGGTPPSSEYAIPKGNKTDIHTPTNMNKS